MGPPLGYMNPPPSHPGLRGSPSHRPGQRFCCLLFFLGGERGFYPSACHIPEAAMLMLVGVPAPHCPLRGLGWFGTGQPGPVLGQPPASGGSWGQEHRVGLPPPAVPLFAREDDGGWVSALCPPPHLVARSLLVLVE